MAKTLQPGDIVPGRRLSPLGGGSSVRLGPNRLRPQVLVVTHDEPCDACATYLTPLAESEVLRAERADVLALAGPAWEGRWSAPVPGVVADPMIVEGLSPAGTPVVAVADRFGQLFTRVEAGDGHAFPEVDQVVSALLDIAIRCPECGVPDVPSPEQLPEAGTRSGGMLLGQ